MSSPIDRRKAPRLGSSTRIQWCVIGTTDTQVDRLSDVSEGGAAVATESVAKVGEEVRFELLDDVGEKFATGLARVSWVNGTKGMGLEFRALGIDRAIFAKIQIAEPEPEPPKEPTAPPPPPVPKRGPPPLPIARRDPSEPPEELQLEDDETAPQIEPLAVKRTGIIIGIDLGTTNTCVSYVVKGLPKIIPGRTGTNTVPSMITFDPDGTFHVGQRAADRHILYPERTVYGSKRLIGRTYRDDLAAELQKHFAYPLGEAEGQRFGVRLKEGVVSMDTIAARVLAEVKSTAEAYVGEKVESAVITVPAYFSEVQRDAVRRAAKEANLAVHRIVNEPTAAAVAYGHRQPQRKARIAVWDCGGGTFDFSVVDLSDGQLEVIATGGDNFVGGSDFDDVLASYLLTEFQKKENLDVDPDPQQIARLRDAAELAKRALSVQTDYFVDLPEFSREPRRALAVEVTRDVFEELTKSLVERTVEIASEVLRSISLEPTAIDDVLLVGGTTRIPAVRRAVQNLFQRRPSQRINPDEAVARGAALLADEIGSAATPTLLDILPMSVGRGAEGLRFVPIVSRYTRLPASCEVTQAANLLGRVSMPIFQGESADVSQNEYLCSAVVADAALKDGRDVVFRISFDEHCVMAIDARDASTGRKLATALDRSRSVDEILRDLGKFEGPKQTAWRPPETGLGRVLGKLFKMFGRLG